MPTAGELIFESIPSDKVEIVNTSELSQIGKTTTAITSTTTNKDELQKEIDRLKKEVNTYKLKEVEKQQAEFGEKR